MKNRRVIVVIVVIVITLAVLYLGMTMITEGVGSIHTPPDHNDPGALEKYTPPPDHTPLYLHTPGNTPPPGHTPPIQHQGQ